MVLASLYGFFYGWSVFSAKLRRRFQLRRVVTLATTVALIACTLGVPIPLAQPQKEVSEPYPCMDCGCGCASAEMCWNNCCCYTQQEKLAWAKKNRVTPPEYVVAAARLERLAALLEKNDSCCASSKPNCCSKTKSCCDSGTASCDLESTPAPKKRSGSRTLVMFKVMQCQGLGAHWVFAPIFLPADAGTPTLEFLPFESVVSFTPCFTSHPSQPSTPPPQFA